jgi:hypothetical protein
VPPFPLATATTTPSPPDDATAAARRNHRRSDRHPGRSGSSCSKGHLPARPLSPRPLVQSGHLAVGHETSDPATAFGPSPATTAAPGSPSAAKADPPSAEYSSCDRRAAMSAARSPCPGPARPDRP